MEKKPEPKKDKSPRVGTVTLTRFELFEKFKELKSKVYETILKNDEKGFTEFTKKFYEDEGDANSCVITAMLLTYCHGMLDSVLLRKSADNLNKVFGDKDSDACPTA
jgi:hypothetical protein